MDMNRGVNHEIEVLFGGGFYFIKVLRRGIILANSDKNKIDTDSRRDSLSTHLFIKNQRRLYLPVTGLAEDAIILGFVTKVSSLLISLQKIIRARKTSTPSCMKTHLQSH